MPDDSRSTDQTAKREPPEELKLDKETVRDLTPPEEQSEQVKGGCANGTCNYPSGVSK